MPKISVRICALLQSTYSIYAVRTLDLVLDLVSKELAKGINSMASRDFFHLRKNHETGHTDSDSPNWTTN